MYTYMTFKLKFLDVTDSNPTCLESLLPSKEQWLNEEGYQFFTQKFPTLFSINGTIEENIGLFEVFEPFLTKNF